MKKLLAVLIFSIVFFSCTKNDFDKKYCWECLHQNINNKDTIHYIQEWCNYSSSDIEVIEKYNTHTYITNSDTVIVIMTCNKKNK